MSSDHSWPPLTAEPTHEQLLAMTTRGEELLSMGIKTTVSEQEYGLIQVLVTIPDPKLDYLVEEATVIGYHLANALDLFDEPHEPEGSGPLPDIDITG